MFELVKRATIACLVVCGMSATIGNPAAAQEFNEIQAVIKPQLQLERSRHIRQLIQRIGRDKFKRSNSMGSSASFGADLDNEPEITGDESASGSANAWSEAMTSRLEDSAPIRAYDAIQNSFSLGLDKDFSERLTLGLIGNYSESDVDNIFVPGNSTAEVVSAGPYFAYFITDTVVLTGSFLYSWTDNGASSGGVVARYDSEGWTANATLTSYHFYNDVLLAPSVGLSFDEERDDAYTDSAATFFPSSTLRNSTLNFGITASTSRDLSNGWVMDPSVGIEGEWTFDSSVDAPTTVVANAEDFDANVTLGADFQWNDLVSIEFTGTYSGIAKSDYESLSGSVRLSVSF